MPFFYLDVAQSLSSTIIRTEGRHSIVQVKINIMIFLYTFTEFRFYWQQVTVGSGIGCTPNKLQLSDKSLLVPSMVRHGAAVSCHVMIWKKWWPSLLILVVLFKSKPDRWFEHTLNVIFKSQNMNHCKYCGKYPGLHLDIASPCVVLDFMDFVVTTNATPWQNDVII